MHSIFIRLDLKSGLDFIVWMTLAMSFYTGDKVNIVLWILIRSIIILIVVW